MYVYIYKYTISFYWQYFLVSMHWHQIPLRWRHNGHECVSNHQPRHCLPNRLFERRSKKTSKLRVTGLCAGNSPGTGEFPAQMASNAENVSIWWRHHALPDIGSHHADSTVTTYSLTWITLRNKHITVHCMLRHWGRDKMASILQTTFFIILNGNHHILIQMSLKCVS